jgi:hypothetical protein
MVSSFRSARRTSDVWRSARASILELILVIPNRAAARRPPSEGQARELGCVRFFDSLGETAMAKATKKPRPWTKEDVRLLKTLVREKTKTNVVARKLKRTEGATRQKASVLGVKLAGPQPKAKA